ncbi:hypothetical protein TRVL_06670 [Trypanosoma vivax]|nr:hypothetical protein TRVL_06670 [Trypanosoma vivax]
MHGTSALSPWPLVGRRLRCARFSPQRPLDQPMPGSRLAIAGVAGRGLPSVSSWALLTRTLRHHAHVVHVHFLPLPEPARASLRHARGGWPVCLLELATGAGLRRKGSSMGAGRDATGPGHLRRHRVSGNWPFIRF